MARVNLAKRLIARLVSNKGARDDMYDKLKEHDSALDTLEGVSKLYAGALYKVRAVVTTNMSSFSGVSESLDGLTLVKNDRVAVVGQSTPSENGIYVVGTVGSNVANWTRSEDMAASSVVPNGSLIAVAAGTIGAGRIYHFTNAGTITVGSTGMTLDRLYNSTELAAEASALGMPVFKRTVRIQHSDLTDAVNGEAQAVNIGAVLPTSAVVMAHEVNIATLFSGGSATAVKLDIGGTTANAITTQADVFTGAATGALTFATGTHTRGKFSGQQIKATFTPDASHTLDGLTAGDLTITVWFIVLA